MSQRVSDDFGVVTNHLFSTRGEPILCHVGKDMLAAIQGDEGMGHAQRTRGKGAILAAVIVEDAQWFLDGSFSMMERLHVI